MYKSIYLSSGLSAILFSHLPEFADYCEALHILYLIFVDVYLVFVDVWFFPQILEICSKKGWIFVIITVIIMINILLLLLLSFNFIIIPAIINTIDVFSKFG